MKDSSIQTYTWWIGVYLRQLNGESPSQENAVKFLEVMKADHRQNTVAVMRNALHWKYGFNIPSIGIEVGEPKYISLEDIHCMIDNASCNLEKTIMILMFSTACRISEVLKLKKDDIEWDNGVITVTRKGGRRQRVKVDDKGMDALRAWMKVRQSKGNSVFMDYEYHDIYNMIKQTAKKLSLPVTPHVFRHSRVVQLMQSGIDIHIVSDIAGHRRLDTTLQMYGRLRAEDLGKYLEQAKW